MTPDRLSEAEVAELERLEKAATPGPFYVDVSEPDRVGSRFVHPGRISVMGDFFASNLRAEDAALIAAARNALPRLLAERAALREALAVLADDDCWPTKAEKEHARALLAPPAKEQST